MNEEFLGMSDSTVSTSTFIACGIGHPPRNAPSDSEGVIMILSGEYYLNAHRNEIICHQVWTGKTDRGQTKVRIHTNQGQGWIVGGGSDEFVTFTAEEARRCWNHAVDNGATRVYMKANASKDKNKYQYTKAVEAYMKQHLDKVLYDYSDEEGYNLKDVYAAITSVKDKYYE